jgi:hypothetical protein
MALNPRDPLLVAAQRLAAEIEAAVPEGEPGLENAARQARADVLIADIAARLRRVGAQLPDDQFAALVLDLARAALREDGGQNSAAQ